MGSYFKPWRRKIGVVTLVVACVFTVAWVRSLSRYDLVALPCGNVIYCIESMCGEIDFGRLTVQDNRARPYWKSDLIIATNWRYLDEHGNPQACDHLSEDADEIEWRWDWSGFHFGAGDTTNGRLEDYMLPYWSIVIPLTLLSAWLLLNKPRRPNTVQTPEPIARA